MIKITKRLLELLSSKQKKGVIVLLFMMIVGAGLEAVGVSLMLPFVGGIMDNVSESEKWKECIYSILKLNSQRQYIVFLTIILIVVYVLKNAYLLIEYHIQYKFMAEVRYDIQYRLVKSYLSRQYSFFLNNSTGEIIRVINSDTINVFSLMINILNIYTEGLIAAVVAMTVFFINPLMASGIGVVLLLELIIIGRVIKPILNTAGVTYNENLAVANKWIMQLVQGIKSVLVSNKQGFFLENYSKYAREVTDAQRRYQLYTIIPRFLIEAITVVAALVVVLVMILLGENISNIIPLLSAFVVAAIRLLPSANRISSSLNALQYAEASLASVENVLGLASEVEVNEENVEPISFVNNIGVENLFFSYEERLDNVLENVSLSINKGQCVGIIGSSGSGKTTLVDIMLGLLKPQAGSIRIDGENILYCEEAWREMLAYIPQTIFLLDASIRDNVVFGNKVDDKKVWEVLKEAQLDEFINALPDKLETNIGELGVKLSGGQKQRIGIARALYCSPEVLIFDEATSALDTDTELALMNAINTLRGKKTMIIIAHRLSTLENCDVIYRVDNKKVDAVVI